VAGFLAIIFASYVAVNTVFALIYFALGPGTLHGAI